MAAPTVRISKESHQILKELAERTGRTMTAVLDEVLSEYRRKLFFARINAGYAELRADPKALADHQAELKLWDATLKDGLEPDEQWTEDGRCVNPEEGKS